MVSKKFNLDCLDLKWEKFFVRLWKGISNLYAIYIETISVFEKNFSIWRRGPDGFVKNEKKWDINVVKLPWLWIQDRILPDPRY